MTNIDAIRRFLDVNHVSYIRDGPTFRLMDSVVSGVVIAGLVYMTATVTLKNGQLEVY